MNVQLEGAHRTQKGIPTCVVEYIGSHNSVKLRRHSCMLLVDTGAEVSVIHRRIYSVLQPKTEILDRELRLQTANRSTLEIDSQARLQLKIGSQLPPHNFYIAKSLNRNILLGRDWLQKNVARIYFDLGALRLGDEYVTLKDRNISFIARIARPVMLKSKFMHTCMEKSGLRDKLMKRLND